MALHVNANLALKVVRDDARRAGSAAPHDPRAVLAAQFIPAGAHVLDLGGGGGDTLRDHVPFGCVCESADRLAHDKGSLIHTLTGAEIATKAASESDIIAMLGQLEMADDPERLFAHVRHGKQDIIVSYCPTDLLDGAAREARGFTSHLSYAELTQLFDRQGYRIAGSAPVNDTEMMFRLTPTHRLAPVCGYDVAVVSENDGDSFGDRLGVQMINGLLPGEARIHHMTFSTLRDSLASARDSYDLVIVGVGGSMFQPLIGDDVLRILARARSAIGIFGTAYRELIPRIAIERVIDRLDRWYAPFAEDVALYGRGRSNAVHLGDWTIEQFPLAQPSLDEPLQIEARIGTEIPIDRTVELIQRHRRVYSARLHPLLCALTSAEYAAYAEQASDRMPGIVSGKFRSMLIDVFGRAFPEREFFMVDRDAVARYKARVHANVAAMRADVAAMLGNLAVAG